MLNNHLYTAFYSLYYSHTDMPTNKNISKPTTLHWVTLWSLGLLWGCSFFLIKKGLVCYTPVQTASIRIGVTSLAFLPFFIWHFKKINWKNLKYYAIVGLAGSGIPAFLFANAQTEVSSSVSGILNSLTPLFTLIIGIVFFNNKENVRKFFGVLLGLGGAVILILYGKELNTGGHISYSLLIILATICYATSVNTVKKFLQEENPLVLSAVAFQIIGIPSLIVLFNTDFTGKLQLDHEAWVALGYLVILAFVGTFMATVLFFGLVQKTDALFGSMTTYIIPIMAIFLGLLDGEVLEISHGMGMAAILGGVYLSRK
ncbi:MAG: EamA family transporter [Saprospiraceae bacterium]|nr:EamA family transporter [Saprospiraceae bacterium]